MQVLVILGHQHSGSFCHALAAAAVAQLEAAGHRVCFHDLYQEQFDPILPHEEIPCDAVPDPVVERHAAEVQSSGGYVVVHPNWWGQPPAILKGWVDRVLRQGVGYKFGPGGVIELLRGKKALVLTTSNTPRDAEMEIFGDPLENLWKNCIFGFCGVKDFRRRNFESIILSTQEQRGGWLADAARLVAETFPSDRV